MLKIEKFCTPTLEQWKIVMLGMRNPMNSWDKSDTDRMVGRNDLNLAVSLAKAGSTHAKYRRMLPVWVDLVAPLYWWKEFDTYKVGTVSNSCSTMHRIQAKEFTLEDFSHERLVDTDERGYEEGLRFTVFDLNAAREKFLETDDKAYWWQMIQLLPTSYNQKRTVMLNYQVLHDIYRDRRDHKLDEWHTFCGWIETLPYSEVITT